MHSEEEKGGRGRRGRCRKRVEVEERGKREEKGKMEGEREGGQRRKREITIKALIEMESADLEKLDLGRACCQSEEPLCVHPALSDGRDALLYHHSNITPVRSQMIFEGLAKHWLVLPIS